MFKKFYDWAVFIIAIVYLGVAFRGNIQGFGTKNILNTDGLTLFMIVITFFETITSNSKLLMPIINKIKIYMLKRLDYKLYIIFHINDDKLNIGKYKEIIEDKIIDNSGTSKKSVDYIYSRIHSSKCYIRNVHSNLTLLYDDVNSEFTITLDGGVSYRELNSIIGALMNIFMDRSLVSLERMKRIKLSINLERSSLKLTDRFFISEKYKIKNLLFIYEMNKNTEVAISKEDITLESVTTSGFDEGYKELLKLVSEFTVRGKY